MSIPKASPLSGLPGTDPPASNTDEPLYSVKHQERQRVEAKSRIAPLEEAALLKVTRARHLRLRQLGPAEPVPAFGSNHPGDQAVIDLITRNVVAIARSHTSRKGWVTRKRLAEMKRAES